MIGFDIKIGKEKLENKLFELVKATMPTSSVEINSFQVKVDLIGAPKLRVENKSIYTKLPVAVNLSKNAALFSMQGHGKLELELQTNYEVSNQFHLTTKTTISSHSWIEKPVIDFGSLDFTVESLMNMVLNHYNDMMGAAIDKGIKDNLNLPSLVAKGISQMKSEVSKIDIKGMKLWLEPSELLLEPIETDDKFFKAKGSIRAEVACAEKKPFSDTDFQLRWAENLLSDNITLIYFDVTEGLISNLLCDFVNKQEYGGENLVANNCTVDFKPNAVDINLNLLKPISSNVLLKGNPRYNESESKLYIDNLDVSLKASNFIYKLTAPLVNKFLESNIRENLPVDVEDLIKTQLSKYFKGKAEFSGMQLSHTISSVELTEILFKEEGIAAILRVNDGSLGVVI